MRLSVCIATFNRADFIAQTLDSIAAQLTPDVELVVVDGASTDATAQVMADYAARHPQVVYQRETKNCGVDEDFDKAVRYASGEYCWLMSDDDILVPGAISTVLRCLSDDPDVVVANAEVRSKDLGLLLKPSQLEMESDRTFTAHECEALFSATASYLTFIGAVVMRRSTWLARERTPYFGSLFIHFGVIFQPPALPRAKVIARPLVQIRYGNAMWTARGFEVWVDKWPSLVWSFGQFSASARTAITARHPAESLKTLLHYRAIGAYGPSEYLSLLADGKRPHHPWSRLIAALPARGVNGAVALYCLATRNSGARMMVYDLVRARCASSVARWVARRFRFPGNA